MLKHFILRSDAPSTSVFRDTPQWRFHFLQFKYKHKITRINRSFPSVIPGNMIKIYRLPTSFGIFIFQGFDFQTGHRFPQIFG